MKKKMLSLLLALAMVCSMVMPAFAAETSPANGDQIVILHTNDVHCQIDQATDKDTGAVTNVGYAGVAAYKAEMEKTYGAENVTLVDAGDAIQGGPIGTLSKGSYIVDIMNEVGYDIAIPGNHEFDYGMENFLTLAKEKAEYTYLCSNFVDKDGKSVFEGYKTVAYGDVKVAYVGIDTPETFTKSTPTYFQDAKGNYIYGFSEGNNGKDLYAAVQKSVDAARAGGAKYVVAVGHLGIDEASEPWTSTSVIANTTGIDVLIDGHSHSTFETTKPNKDGKDVVVAQTGTKLANIGKIVIDTKTGKITNELVSGYAEQEPKAAAFIKGINDEFDGVLKKVVAKSDVDLTTLNPVTGKRAVRSAETNLGDLCADAYRVMLGADVAFVNGGGVRENIKAGDITYEDIIKVHPFGNEACMVETTGQQILDALEMGSKAVPGELGGFLQVSGLTYSIDASVKSAVVTNDKGEFVKVDGPYRVHDVMVGDKPLDVKATYTLAAHNYMLKSGGDGLVMFKNDKLVKDSVMIDNQVLINYIVDELGGVVGKDYADPYGQGRIAVKYVGVDGAAWYANAAKYVMDKGLMSSTGSGFDPSGTVTRATVFQVLYNMEGKPSAGAASFTDVDGKWYAAAAAWAESTGLAAVGADKLFNGDRTATRQEVATILARYVAYAGIKAEQGGMAMKEMADYSSIASWALEGMGLCYYNGIITGKPGNLLDPAGTATRAQLATMLMNLGKLPKSYTEETVTIAVPAQNGIPAHEIPAIVTLPAGSEGKVPGVVMLHGTGSDKNEAGGGYALAAPLMAKAGIATIRIDFMGNGASKADYVNYNYTSAKLDAKAAADYLAKLATVDAAKLGVMGWSQGGTDALLAAAAYPDTFKAVITWSGATSLAGNTLFPEGFDAAYAAAKKDGSYTMKFDWRGDLSLGARWFEEVKSTDVLKETAKIKAPVLAINGDKDTVVPMDNAAAIKKAAQNGMAWIVDGADHTYNIFTGDKSAITQTVNVGIGFLEEHLNGRLASAEITSVSKYGNVTTNLPMDVLSGAGYQAGDILSITVGGKTIQAPLGDAYSNVDTGKEIILPDSATKTVSVAINMGNFAGTYGVAAGDKLTFAMSEKAGYLDEYNIRNIDARRTNVRADYESDEVFANFRPVVMGGIREGILYRSSSPVNPELGRNTYADALAKKAGIATVINLADDEAGMKAYPGYADSYYATLDVIPLNMGVDFKAADFNAKLKTGLEFMIAKEGPYLIHCNEGKDRAGFTAMLLEALAGGKLDEIKADYMLSYINYYHVEKDSTQYNKIAESNVLANLRMMAGLEAGADLSKVDLAKAAADYLVKTVGLTADQVTALKTALTAPAAEQKAA